MSSLILNPVCVSKVESCERESNNQLIDYTLSQVIDSIQITNVQLRLKLYSINQLRRKLLSENSSSEITLTNDEMKLIPGMSIMVNNFNNKGKSNYIHNMITMVMNDLHQLESLSEKANDTIGILDKLSLNYHFIDFLDKYGLKTISELKSGLVNIIDDPHTMLIGNFIIGLIYQIHHPILISEIQKNIKSKCV